MVEVPTQVPIQVPTQDGVSRWQVYTASGMPLYPEPPTKGRTQIPLTIWFNAAEELELLKWAAAKGVSLPAYVLTAIGYEQWRLEAARGRQERSSQRRPIRHALERRSVTIAQWARD